MGLVHEHSGYEYRDIKLCVMAMWAMHERMYTSTLQGLSPRVARGTRR